MCEDGRNFSHHMLHTDNILNRKVTLRSGMKRRKGNLIFICRKGNVGELMLFSLFINKLTNSNSRIMILKERYMENTVC